MPDYTDIPGSQSDFPEGTYVHPNATTEADVLELLVNIKKTVITYDVSLLTQDTTIRTYEKVDGVTYEITSEVVFPTDYDANVETVIIEFIGKNKDQKITFQSAVLEGAGRSIPWTRRDD